MIAEAETFTEQLSRVRQMATGDPTWDLSDNDMAAITAVIRSHAELLAALKCVRPAIEAETRRWLAEALRERNEETEGKCDGAVSFLETIDAAIATAEAK